MPSTNPPPPAPPAPSLRRRDSNRALRAVRDAAAIAARRLAEKAESIRPPPMTAGGDRGSKP